MGAIEKATRLFAPLPNIWPTQGTQVSQQPPGRFGV